MTTPDDASAAAQAWVDDYKGRRRISDDVMAELVAAEIAHFHGDTHGSDEHRDRAYALLASQGCSIPKRMEIVRRARHQAVREAADQLIHDGQPDLNALDEVPAGDLLWCDDPAAHEVLEHTAAQELRLAPTSPPNWCRWCGRPYNPEELGRA